MKSTSGLTLWDRAKVAPIEPPQMTCSDDDLRVSIWVHWVVFSANREPRDMAQIDRFLDEMLRRKRFFTLKKP